MTVTLQALAHSYASRRTGSEIAAASVCRCPAGSGPTGNEMARRTSPPGVELGLDHRQHELGDPVGAVNGLPRASVSKIASPAAGSWRRWFWDGSRWRLDLRSGSVMPRRCRRMTEALWFWVSPDTRRHLQPGAGRTNGGRRMSPVSFSSNVTGDNRSIRATLSGTQWATALVARPLDDEETSHDRLRRPPHPGHRCKRRHRR